MRAVSDAHRPDVVGTACSGLGACGHFCGIQAAVCCNIHAVQPLECKVVLVSMGVDVERGGCIPR